MSRTTAPAKPRPAAAAAVDDAADIDADIDAHPIQRVYTSTATHGVSKPTGVPSSAFEAGKLATPKRKPYAKPVSFDPATVVIEKGVPIKPINGGGATSSRYLPWLKSMQPGDSVVLTNAQAKALMTFARRKAGMNFVSRTIDAQRTRMWRMPDKGGPK